MVLFGLLLVSVPVEDDTDDRSTSGDPDSEDEATAFGIDWELGLLLDDELSDLLMTVGLLFPSGSSTGGFIVVVDDDVDVPTSFSI